MGWATGIMVYLVVWWIMLFTVLPLGVRRVQNPGQGQDHGAPENPQILRKVIITSLMAAVVWIAFYILQQADIFNFRHWADTY
jgi:predicted secreted protein